MKTPNSGLIRTRENPKDRRTL